MDDLSRLIGQEHTRRSMLRYLVLGSAGAVAVACGGAATSTTGTQGSKLATKTMSLRLNWYIGGLHTPFYLGKDRGYYAAEGIDLDIQEGAGSAKSVQLVANKSNDFAMADAGSLMLAAAQGAQAKSVVSLLNTSTFGVIFLKSSGIKTLKDLEGKKLAVTAGDALTQLWPAVVAANKLNGDKITLVQMDASAKPAAVMQKRVDALLGGVDDQFFLIKYQGFDVSAIRFADVGVNTIAMTVMVHPDTLKSSADYVKGFARATQKAWADAQKDPTAAVQAALKVKSDLNADSTKDQLLADENLMTSPSTKGKPIGYGSKEDWDHTLQLMKQYRGLQTDKASDYFYTDQFIS